MNKDTIKLCAFVGILGFLICLCDAVPKYDSPSAKGSYSNSNNNQWNRSYRDNDTSAAPSSDRVERLGYTSGYGSVNGYQNSGSGVGGYYNPVKIDLGGVVIGALIGIGALLVLPKVANVLSGGYGGYGGGNYRSVDGGDSTGITEMLAKLDDILGKNNIDSTVCMQRTVCSYVRQSAYHHSMGTEDQTDQLISAFSGNALVEYMLDGTAVKEALANGKNLNADPCEKLYPRCPLDREQAMQVLSTLIPSNDSSNKKQ